MVAETITKGSGNESVNRPRGLMRCNHKKETKTSRHCSILTHSSIRDECVTSQSSIAVNSTIVIEEARKETTALFCFLQVIYFHLLLLEDSLSVLWVPPLCPFLYSC